MASGNGNNFQLPSFCFPLTESHRLTNSTPHLYTNGVNHKTPLEPEFTIPTALNTEAYREYYNERRNAMCENSNIQLPNHADGNDISIIGPKDDSVISTATRPVIHRTLPKNIKSVHYDTHNISNGSNTGLSRLFTRFGKRRKSACDLREYFSDTEREVKGKNKGKIRLRLYYYCLFCSSFTF